MSVYIPLNSPSWSSPNIPQELIGSISVQCWDELRSAVFSSSDISNLCACCCEIVICMTTAFFCIFCCHPCIAGACAQTMLSGKIAVLNDTHYGSRQIIACTVKGIQIQTVGRVQNVNVAYVNQPGHIDPRNLGPNPQMQHYPNSQVVQQPYNNNQQQQYSNNQMQQQQYPNMSQSYPQPHTPTSAEYPLANAQEYSSNSAQNNFTPAMASSGVPLAVATVIHDTEHNRSGDHPIKG